jgi:hypothetical protein
MVHLERVGRRTGEPRREVDQHPRRRPGVAVDGLVVVTDGEHLLQRAGEQPHQQHEGRRQVLGLVDQQVHAGATHAGAQRRVGQQQLDGAVDLLVEVEAAVRMQPPSVAGDEHCEARDVTASCLDVRRIAQCEAHLRQRCDVGGRRGASSEQVGDQPGHVLLGQDARPLAGRRRADREAQRMHGADVRSHAIDAHIAHPLRELLGGPRVVRERGHARRCDPTVEHEVAQACGEHPGLARPGGCDHARGTAVMLDGRALVRGQLLRGLRPRRRSASVGVESSVACGVDGSAGRCVEGCAERCVRIDEADEFLAQQPMPVAEQPQRTVLDLGPAPVRRRVPQVEQHGLSCLQRCPQTVDQRRQLGPPPGTLGREGPEELGGERRPTGGRCLARPLDRPWGRVVAQPAGAAS